MDNDTRSYIVEVNQSVVPKTGGVCKMIVSFIALYSF